MALSHKKKTAGRPPDWPEETESDAEWERLASNEVIWEEMINGSRNVQEIDSEEVTLDADEASEEDTLDAVSRIEEETQRTENDSPTKETAVAEPSDETVKVIHGERSEVATGQQKNVYTMVTGQNLSTGQQLRVKSMIDSGNTLRRGVAITDAFRKRLGLKYSSVRPKTVGTADKTGKMIQLGITE